MLISTRRPVTTSDASDRGRCRRPRRPLALPVGNVSRAIRTWLARTERAAEDQTAASVSPLTSSAGLELLGVGLGILAVGLLLHAKWLVPAAVATLTARALRMVTGGLFSTPVLAVARHCRQSAPAAGPDQPARTRMLGSPPRRRNGMVGSGLTPRASRVWRPAPSRALAGVRTRTLRARDNCGDRPHGATVLVVALRLSRIQQPALVHELVFEESSRGVEDVEDGSVGH